MFQVHRPASPQPLVSAVVEPPSRRVPVAALHIGALLLARGLVRPDQLSAALQVQAETPYLRLGEILMGLGHLSFGQLKGVLEEQYHDMRLGDCLMQLGLAALPQLEAALEMQERTGMRLGPALIELGVVTEAQIYRALASQE